jgi:hypothetical protein
MVFSTNKKSIAFIHKPISVDNRKKDIIESTQQTIQYFKYNMFERAKITDANCKTCGK